MLEEFEQFYNSNRYILGDGLKQFEKEFAAFTGVNHAIGVGNGHDALLIILKSLDIDPGDEVLLPAHTYIASALPVLHVGAKPVPVDIDRETFNIDVSHIAEKVNENTRAIIPVHLYGNPCDLESIFSIAEKYNLYVIEDNAQGHGAEYNGRKTGSFGIANFTSFYPTKNLGALGDGGMITTDSDNIAEKANALRNYGKTVDNEYSITGLNSRLDELQARLLSVKLQHLDRWNKVRKEIANQYFEELKSVEEVALQKKRPGNRHVHHIFPILASSRDKLRHYLNEKGIDTLIHYEKPIHLHSALSDLNYPAGSFPVAENVCADELSLPIYPGLSGNDISYVCNQIKDFFAHR